LVQGIFGPFKAAISFERKVLREPLTHWKGKQIWNDYWGFDIYQIQMELIPFKGSDFA